MSVGSRLLLPVMVELVYCCLHTLRGHTYVFFFFTAHHGEVQSSLSMQLQNNLWKSMTGIPQKKMETHETSMKNCRFEKAI